MSGHTPGPWHVVENPKGWSRLEISSIDRSDKVAIATVEVEFDEPFESEQQANARLLAIAPAMFKALCELIERAGASDDALYGMLSTTFVREIAESAIAGYSPTPTQPGEARE